MPTRIKFYRLVAAHTAQRERLGVKCHFWQTARMKERMNKKKNKTYLSPTTATQSPSFFFCSWIVIRAISTQRANMYYVASAWAIFNDGNKIQKHVSQQSFFCVPWLGTAKTVARQINVIALIDIRFRWPISEMANLVDDYATSKSIPTVHGIRFESIIAKPNIAKSKNVAHKSIPPIVSPMLNSCVHKTGE